MLENRKVWMRFSRQLSPAKPDCPSVAKHRDLLEQEGFIRISGEEISLHCQGGSLAGLVAAARSLPEDPDADGLRQRVYRTATFYPWSGTLRFDETFVDNAGRRYVPYYQPATLNQDAGGRERRFAPLPDRLEEDPLLKRLVILLFAMLPGEMIERRLPIRVGIHLIRLWSDGRRIALPSPNTLHTDGEPWTAIIFIGRENVADGTAKNFVAKRNCRGRQPHEIDREDIFFQGTLTEPLETILVDDSRVCHSVTGCLGAHGRPGWRTSLLIDYSDLRPYRTA